MSDAYRPEDAPTFGHGLDPDSADLCGRSADCAADEDCPRPGEGDAVVLAWARAM